LKVEAPRSTHKKKIQAELVYANWDKLKLFGFVFVLLIFPFCFHTVRILSLKDQLGGIYY
jgi:hypothetical protein